MDGIDGRDGIHGMLIWIDWMAGTDGYMGWPISMDGMPEKAGIDEMADMDRWDGWDALHGWDGL